MIEDDSPEDILEQQVERRIRRNEDTDEEKYYEQGSWGDLEDGIGNV